MLREGHAPDFTARLKLMSGAPVDQPMTLHYGLDSKDLLVFPWLDFNKFLALLNLTSDGRQWLERFDREKHIMLFKNFVDPVVQLMKANGISTPVLLRMADGRDDFDFPTLTKSVGITNEKRQRYVLNLNVPRHWGHIPVVRNHDIEHDAKHSKLIWRGATTGSFHIASTHSLTRSNLALNFDKFGEHDLGFTEIVQLNEAISRVPPAKLKTMLREAVSVQEQLKYKYLLSLEGNDVASGLKWMLYSNSTVLMPHPTCETWACESQLKPYVHYVPLEDDLSDLNDKVMWCRDNPIDVNYIAACGKAYISEFMDPETEDKLASSILMKACASGRIEIEKVLIKEIEKIRDGKLRTLD
jgi:hypothetical protein